MSRIRWSLACLLLLTTLSAAGAVALGGSAAAQALYPLDPVANIPPPSAADVPCTTHPFGPRCERIMIRALNHARSVMGQPAYTLPSRFKALTGAEQLLVLSNQDRRLYRRVPITGLNPTLNASAQYGATHDADPKFVPVGSNTPARASATWAGGLRSALLAYYHWMYVDGVSDGRTGNLDCRRAGDSGCWNHRHATLLSAGSSTNKVAMGVGHGTGPSGMPAWTELYEVFWPSARISYVPTVTGLSSYSGSYASGQTLRISGFGFVHVRRVTFGDTPAIFSVASHTAIRVVVPPNRTGRTHVRVTAGGGTSNPTAAAAYTYT